VADTPAQQAGSYPPDRTIGIAILVIVVIFSVFVGILWRAGFLTPRPSDSEYKLFAEVLTFVGGLIGAVISVLGVLLKYSIDRRTESRQAAEFQRSEAAKEQEERRLKLEAATKVIQLFVTSDGKEAPSTQIAGGLLTLASLGQLSLALDLTNLLLQQKKLDAGTAALVIDQALQQTDNEEVQINAIGLLLHHPADMLSPDGFEFPMTILNWDATLGSYAREWAPVALGRMITKRPLSSWRSDFDTKANAVIAALALGWLHPTDETLKNDCAVILGRMLRAFPNTGTLRHPKELIDTDKIRAELGSLPAGTAAADVVVAALDKWISETDPKERMGKSVTTEVA